MTLEEKVKELRERLHAEGKALVGEEGLAKRMGLKTHSGWAGPRGKWIAPNDKNKAVFATHGWRYGNLTTTDSGSEIGSEIARNGLTISG